MLGVPATPWGADAKVFGHQTLRDNVALLDDELLQQINARVDLLKQFVIEQGDVVPQGLMAEDLGVRSPRGGGHAEHLADQRVMISTTATFSVIATFSTP